VPWRKKGIRLVLVDDHQVVRSGLADVARQRKRYEIVGEAGTAERLCLGLEHGSQMLS